MKNAIIYLIVYLKCSHQHVMCRSLGVVKILEAVTKCFVSFTSLNTIVKKMNTNLKHGINFILALDIYLFIFFSSHFYSRYFRAVEIINYEYIDGIDTFVRLVQLPSFYAIHFISTE